MFEYGSVVRGFLARISGQPLRLATVGPRDRQRRLFERAAFNCLSEPGGHGPALSGVTRDSRASAGC
jgi:hypothetical protein